MRCTLLGNTTSYATRRFKEEAPSLGIEFTAVALKDVVVDVTDSTFSLFDTEGNDLATSDCYFFRGIGEADQEVMVIAKYLLAHGAVLVEEKTGSGALLMDKIFLYTTDKRVPTLDYSMFQSKSALLQVIETVSYPIVMKSTIGSKGAHVMLAHSKEELLAGYDKLGPRVILQTYLPVQYDVRVIVVGGQYLGALKRSREDGEFRMNRPGNKRECITLPEEVVRMCEEVALSQEIEVAGIDLIEHEGMWYVLEVNTSPQFKVFETYTKVNVAKRILEYAQRKVQDKKKRIPIATT